MMASEMMRSEMMRSEMMRREDLTMRRADLMKPDVFSEVLLILSGVVLFLPLFLIGVAALMGAH
jgi:hypothetical protein